MSKRFEYVQPQKCQALRLRCQLADCNTMVTKSRNVKDNPRTNLNCYNCKANTKLKVAFNVLK